MGLKKGVYQVKGEAADDKGTRYPCLGKFELHEDKKKGIKAVTGVLNDTNTGAFGGSSLILSGSWTKNEISFEVRDADEMETYKYEGGWTQLSVFNSEEGVLRGEWQHIDWPSERKTQYGQNRGSFEFLTHGPKEPVRKTYEIRIITGNFQEIASANSQAQASVLEKYSVFVQLHGKEKSSMPLILDEDKLSTKNGDLYRMNQDDGFKVAVDENVRSLENITVGHNCTDAGKGHYISRVEVINDQGHYLVFPFEMWLDPGRAFCQALSGPSLQVRPLPSKRAFLPEARGLPKRLPPEASPARGLPKRARPPRSAVPPLKAFSPEARPPEARGSLPRSARPSPARRAAPPQSARPPPGALPSPEARALLPRARVLPLPKLPSFKRWAPSSLERGSSLGARRLLPLKRGPSPEARGSSSLKRAALHPKRAAPPPEARGSSPKLRPLKRAGPSPRAASLKLRPSPRSARSSF
ncbi:hypothetical protein CYMTET_32273 [Cymbomonas tetramitiformis]|uniref:PLAT domain-containing protein n=1 Tax=Cymbomonas tetramitiformis TaxID=36881 RepID=A0AAE0KS35_9CHLO|nr:hypothetical protein CYMTET_32273 [Cymbomonas tetramitiformis]